MAIYFNSENPTAGAGTEGNPYKSLSGYNITAADADIRLFADSGFNLTSGITLDNYLNAGVRITKHGVGADPIISSYTVDDGTGWTEIDASAILAAGGKLIRAASGTNLWFKNASVGMLLGSEKEWSRKRDIYGDIASYGVRVPAAKYECAAVIADGSSPVSGGSSGGVVLWSVGNPVSYYGGILLKPLGLTYLISALQPRQGVYVNGLKFKDVLSPVLYMSAGTNHLLSRDVQVTGNQFTNVLHGVMCAFGVANESANSGWLKLVIENNLAQNLGHSMFGCWGVAGGSAVFNDSRICNNVISGAGKHISFAGLYLLNMRTTNGSWIDVSNNAVSDVSDGNIWVDDGVGIYADYRSRNLDIHDNYVWNCKRPYYCNGSTGVILWTRNVAIAYPKPFNLASTGAPVKSTFFSISNPNGMTVPFQLSVQQNIAIGFQQFFSGNDISAQTGSTVNIKNNVSLAGASPTYACITHDSSQYTIEGNNFYGHSPSDWYRFGVSPADIGASATNKITSNPTVALRAIFQNPTDSTYNYAATIPRSSWGTAPAWSSALHTKP